MVALPLKSACVSFSFRSFRDRMPVSSRSKSLMAFRAASSRVCRYPLEAGFPFLAGVGAAFGFSVRRSRRSGCLALSAAFAASALVGRPLAGAASAVGAGALRFAISPSFHSSRRSRRPAPAAGGPPRLSAPRRTEITKAARGPPISGHPGYAAASLADADVAVARDALPLGGVRFQEAAEVLRPVGDHDRALGRQPAADLRVPNCFAR